MTLLYKDTETFSRVDLKAAGTYKYAANAEIMIITYAFDDGPVFTWDYTEGLPPPDVSNIDCEVVAHNAMFDRNVLRLGNLKIDIPLERWRCTMVQAMQHALPGGLEALGRVLGLPQDMQKISEGKKLIQRFCKLHPVRTNRQTEALQAIPLADDRNIGLMVYFGADIKKAVRENKCGFLMGIQPTESRSYVDADGRRHGTARSFAAVSAAMEVPDEVRIDMVRYDHTTHPADWERFKDYARMDIVSMREIHKRLPTWNWQADDVAMWHLDQRINDRGFAVDTELTAAGARAAIEEKEYLGKRFAELTGGLQPSQRAQVQAFLNNIYTLGITSTAKHVMEPLAANKSMPEAVREIARIVLASNKTSTAKYAALAAATCDDDRFRGGLQFAGASRTRRWAGRKFQPHNLPSRGLPAEALIDAYIHALKAGCHRDMFDDLMLYGAAALRGVVVANRGQENVRTNNFI